jgi:ElaB/YqjD/DUF883 family membrane-anchored ribosome-binding protein
MSSTTDRTGHDQGLVEDVSEKAHEAASAAQEKASELKERGSRSLGEKLDERTTEAGSQMRRFGEALRRTGEEIRSEGSDGAARLADQAAERIQGLGSYLEHKRGDELMADAEGFARKRPWAVAGIGLVAGFVASRFLKASSERRHSDRYAASGESSTLAHGGVMPAGAHRSAGTHDPYAEVASEPLSYERGLESGGGHGGER